MSTGSHTFKELWDLVEPVVQGEGLQLYDIERASNGSSGGIIRVFLMRKGGESASLAEGEPSLEEEVALNEEGELEEGTFQQGGVTVDDCALISRKLSAIDRFEEFLGEHSVLEVSSPGINRKLRLERHFQSSVGERITVKAYFDELGKERKVTGFLLKCENEEIVIKEAVGGEERNIALSDISTARIDFDFSSPNGFQKSKKGEKAKKVSGSKKGKKKQRKN